MGNETRGKREGGTGGRAAGEEWEGRGRGQAAVVPGGAAVVGFSSRDGRKARTRCCVLSGERKGATRANSERIRSSRPLN